MPLFFSISETTVGILPASLAIVCVVRHYDQITSFGILITNGWCWVYKDTLTLTSGRVDAVNSLIVSFFIIIYVMYDTKPVKWIGG